MVDGSVSYNVSARERTADLGLSLLKPEVSSIPMI